MRFCHICMREGELELKVDEIGVTYYFCDKHYPTEWDDRK